MNIQPNSRLCIRHHRYLIPLFSFYIVGVVACDVTDKGTFESRLCHSALDCQQGYRCADGFCQFDEREIEPDDLIGDTDEPYDNVDYSDNTADTNDLFDTHENETEHDTVGESDEESDEENDEENEPDITPACDDFDRDGYPGTGDGCDPEDPTYDCNDRSEQVNPSADESCDGLDNDCDDLIDSDDSSMTTPSCERFQGVCEGLTMPCVDGHLRSCSEEDYSAHSEHFVMTEDGQDIQCDTLDNDCDGQVDEEISHSCYTGSLETQNIGMCRNGTTTCVNGQFSECIGQVLPDVESGNVNCDGLDNDCDRNVDEECECVYDAESNPTQECYNGPEGSLDVGTCHAGVQECQPNDRWGVCTGSVTPSDETCSNMDADDNCDGLPDNIPSLGISCTNYGERGICREGTFQCQGASVQCVSFHEEGTVAESCNGLDDDCDGTPDDGAGICSLPHAFSSCVEGTCVVDTCMLNATNEDGLDENGCEVWCDSGVFGTLEPISPNIAGSIVYNGSDFAVAYSAQGGIYFNTIGLDGSSAEEQLITTSVVDIAMLLVWTGSEYAIMWDGFGGDGAVLFFLRVSSSGEKLIEDAEIDNTSISVGRSYLYGAWTGTEFGAVWDSNPDSQIYLNRLSLQGDNLSGNIPIAGTESAFNPSMVWTCSNFGIVWLGSSNGYFRVFFTVLSAQGQILVDDTTVTEESTDASTYPISIAWTGEEYGVAWVDGRNSSSQLFFTTFSSTGVKLIEDIRVLDEQVHPTTLKLIWSGNRFLLAWATDDGRGSFVRLRRDGTVKGEKVVFGVPNDFVFFSVAVDENHYGFLGKNYDNAGFNYAVFECGDDGQ